MRVVAAMSGGVDSAVAAARAHEAGHDVTGIHLALSRNPASYRSGARGCCTIEDANDARRAADVIGIPFYVWDLSERFHQDVVEDFMDEYAAGRTPNPCLRCNEKIKFAAVLDRALALGFDAVATGHYAQLRAASDGSVELHRAVDPGKDQSYVLGVLTQEQLAHSLFPLGDTPKPEVRAEAAARGLLVADKPDSHDICFVADGDNAGWLREKLGDRAPNHGGAILDASSGEELGRHDGTYALHHRAAARAAAGRARGRRQAAVRARHRAGLRHGDGRPARRADRRPDHRRPAALVRRRARRRTPGRCSSGRTAPPHRARVEVVGDRVVDRPPRPRPGHRPRSGRGDVRRHPGRRLGDHRLGRPRRRARVTVASGVGSWPGTDAEDYAEAVRLVLGEAPDLPYLPELPGRGAGAAMTGRTLAMIGDLGFDLQPAGWRLTDRPGIDLRRARSLLAQDLDQLEDLAQDFHGVLKVQLAGPWTLAATVERPRGDKLLADHGARRELAQALAEGVAAHLADVRRRVAAAHVVVQVDEPALAAVLAGAIPTASGFGRHRVVHPPEASEALAEVLEAGRDGAVGALVRPGHAVAAAARGGCPGPER